MNTMSKKKGWIEMRKALFAAIAAVCAAGAFGEEVSSDDALLAAKGWISLKEALGEQFSAEPENVRTYEAKDGKGRYHVVSLKGGGFVVTSADTEIEPILAFSQEGVWSDSEAENALKVMLNIDVACLAEHSSAIKSDSSAIKSDSSATQTEEGEAAGGSPSSATARGGLRLAAVGSNGRDARSPSAKWARLKAANGKTGPRLKAALGDKSITDLRVPALLKTKWYQRDGGENYYTPNNRVCGCVATGGSQILYYWKWPTNSITAVANYNGTVDGLPWDIESGYQASSASTDRTAWDPPFGGIYDWDSMPTNSSSSTSAAKKKALGRLTRDVGLACHMDYASGGSGSTYSGLKLCIVNQFGYKNSAILTSNSALSIGNVKNAILPSLDFKSPCGVAVPGHAIVADGYGYSGGTLYVHFNFGWAGTGDAWYCPPDLTNAGISQTSGFTSINSVIYNIYPPKVCDESGRDTIISGRILGSSGTPLSGITVTAQKGASSYAATTDDKGIYALLVPKNAAYSIRAAQNDIVATTNVSVSNWSSTSVGWNGSNFWYSNGGSVGNVHGVELSLAPLGTVEVPVFEPAGGTVFFRDDITVAVSCATEGAEIRYTLDGSEPTAESSLYAGAFSISSNATFKARAFRDNYHPSAIVVASYRHCALLGENLVLNASPAQGGTQTLSAPAPGTYAASFSYSGVEGRYGESVELRLARGGVTNTLATVSADGAGTFTTNFTFEVSDAGDYELFLHNPAPGTEQPVTVTDLSIMLPADKANLRNYWIHETERTFGATGEWSGGAAFRDGRIDVDSGDEVAFTPDRQARGGRTLITSTMVFDMACRDNEDYVNAKTALHIGLDATTGGRVFQALTSDGGSNVWLNVHAEGISEPELNTPYTFEFVLRRGSRTYSVSLVNGNAKTPLAAEGGAVWFPYASGAGRSVERVRYVGEGGVTELYGRDGESGMVITLE